MRRKILVICLTVLLFLSAAVLGVSAVFRVKSVVIEKSTVSEAASKEAAAFQQRLEDAYLKDSMLFVDDSEAKEIIKEFPYFRLTGFRKEQPNKIVVSISEDAEVYSVAKADGTGYYQLGADGSVLGVSETPKNRLDGKDNVLLKGFNVLVDGAQLVGDTCYLPIMEFCQELDVLFGGIRRNVKEVSVYNRTPSQVFVFEMFESVKMYVVDPSMLTKEKAAMAVDKYLSLSDEQKLKGCIVVSGSENEPIVVYNPVDNFSS
jgi:hypothetical protein